VRTAIRDLVAATDQDGVRVTLGTLPTRQ